MQVFIFCLMSSKYGHEFSHIMSPGARPICRAVSDVIFCVFNIECRELDETITHYLKTVILSFTTE